MDTHYMDTHYSHLGGPGSQILHPCKSKPGHAHGGQAGAHTLHSTPDHTLLGLPAPGPTQPDRAGSHPIASPRLSAPRPSPLTSPPLLLTPHPPPHPPPGTRAPTRVWVWVHSIPAPQSPPPWPAHAQPCSCRSQGGLVREAGGVYCVCTCVCVSVWGGMRLQRKGEGRKTAAALRSDTSRSAPGSTQTLKPHI